MEGGDSQHSRAEKVPDHHRHHGPRDYNTSMLRTIGHRTGYTLLPPSEGISTHIFHVTQ